MFIAACSARFNCLLSLVVVSIVVLPDPSYLVVEEGVVDLSCLLNCLRVSLLGFSSVCLTLFILLLLCQGVSILYFVRRWCRPCPVWF